MRDSALLFIHCLTSTHPGTGTALGVVDLPVQRERHTQWPTVPGSSLKGVLRAACASKSGRRDEHVLSAFGPETAAASEHAGALSISDARLLAFPVRSLKGVFAWTTCPSVLCRLQRDLEVIGGRGFPEVPDVGKDTVATPPQSPLGIDGRALLEEFEFRLDDPKHLALAVSAWVAKRAVKDCGTKRRIESHFAILHDDDFTHFARHATEVTARVGLDYQRKTAKTGALFYEESLPPETLFYALVRADDSRRERFRRSSADLMDWLRGNLGRTLQIGGGESVGKGICAVRLVDPVHEEL